MQLTAGDNQSLVNESTVHLTSAGAVDKKSTTNETCCHSHIKS